MRMRTDWMSCEDLEAVEAVRESFGSSLPRICGCGFACQWSSGAADKNQRWGGIELRTNPTFFLQARALESITVGYEDDRYGDNGYWRHDDGTQKQFKSIGGAAVEVDVLRGGLDSARENCGRYRDPSHPPTRILSNGGACHRTDAQSRSFLVVKTTRGTKNCVLEKQAGGLTGFYSEGNAAMQVSR
jgi:hypothetical protein